MPGISFIIARRPREEIGQTVRAVHAACEEAGLAHEILSAWGNNPTVQRNLCVRRARFSVLYFLDNDSLLAAGTLRRLCDVLRAEPDADIVGGPSVTAPGDTALQRSFGAVLSSRFGVGPIAARYHPVGTLRETDDRELILCNMVVKKAVFADVGPFDEHLYPNEENEFIFRARTAGHRVFYDPRIVVQRSQRESLSAFVRQIFRYGRGRGEQTRRATASFNLFLLAPILFAAYVLALLPAGLAIAQVAPAHARAVLLGLICAPLFLYVTGALFSTVLLSIRDRVAYPVLSFLFLLNHLSYAAGLAWGLARRDYKADREAFDGGIDDPQ